MPFSSSASTTLIDVRTCTVVYSCIYDPVNHALALEQLDERRVYLTVQLHRLNAAAFASSEIESAVNLSCEVSNLQHLVFGVFVVTVPKLSTPGPPEAEAAILVRALMTPEIWIGSVKQFVEFSVDDA